MGRKPVIQTHHLSYDPEIKGKLFKGEHLLLTRLGWRKNISKYFIKCLKNWIILNEDKARDLETEEKNGKKT